MSSKEFFQRIKRMRDNLHSLGHLLDCSNNAIGESDWAKEVENWVGHLVNECKGGLTLPQKKLQSLFYTYGNQHKCWGLEYYDDNNLGQALRVCLNENGMLQLPTEDFRVRLGNTGIFADFSTPMQALKAYALSLERKESNK